MNHNQLANEVIRELEDVGYVSQILLFGSVSKNTMKADSDVDIAVVLDDHIRGMILDLEGFPMGLCEEMKDITKPYSRLAGIKVDLLFCYQDQLESGIELCGKGIFPADNLKEVGLVKYDVLSDLI